jgi:hypothetical protein
MFKRTYVTAARALAGGGPAFVSTGAETNRSV